MASQITSLTIVYSTVYSICRSKKTSKLRVTGLCAGNSHVTSEFPAQRASNAVSVSIWWRRHGLSQLKWKYWFFTFSSINTLWNDKSCTLFPTIYFSCYLSDFVVVWILKHFIFRWCHDYYMCPNSVTSHKCPCNVAVKKALRKWRKSTFNQHKKTKTGCIPLEVSRVLLDLVMIYRKFIVRCLNQE